jgi:hypothetical protein
MADINAIAKQFTDLYYTTFDSDRQGSVMKGLYRDHSMLTFEGEAFQGAAPILERLQRAPEKVQHKVTTLDAQPSSPNVASLLVSVTGVLLVEGEEHPINFSQVFQLVPEGSMYYVFNDIFRLNYG